MMNPYIMKRLILLLFSVILLQSFIFSQEQLSGLSSNPVIKHELKSIDITDMGIRNFEYPRALHLPFFDDFHTANIFPDTARYIDKYAFINDDFPYRSVNIGAATLDAIDDNGDIYPDASMFPFIADHLTSRPIRLDTLFLPGETRAITLADSVYFSFFYQPQGRGNQPESVDSLVLQFGHYAGDSVFAYVDSTNFEAQQIYYPLDTLWVPSGLGCNEGMYMICYDTILPLEIIPVPCDSVFEPSIQWERIWSSPGMTLDTFYSRYNTYSRQVIIPVNDSAKYYKEHFYFRFYNWASMASDVNPSWKSNCDQWNVDYIYLNVDRSAADTFYRQITFAERAPSFLDKYTSMPLRQYRNDPTNQLKDSLKMYITNLSADTFNVYYEYIVDEQGGSYTHTYNGGFANLYPFFLTGYQNCESVPQHACPPRDFLFPLSSQSDSTSYMIRHVIHDQSNPDLGDTIHFIQKFYNYYAYDDGTPEMGYGLSIAGGSAGLKFTLNLADSLKGIAMFFNKVQNNQNDQFFNLKVWDNNNGKPGNVIWEMENVKPKFSNDLNRIQIYKVDPPLPLLGTFFIGFEQTTSDLLNVGFDTHSDASSYLYYNATGSWEQSLMTGSLIMRPVLNQYYDPFLVEEEVLNSNWNIYPNPVTGDQLKIHNSLLSESQLRNSGAMIMLYDMLGRPSIRQSFANTIAVDALPAGFYLLQIVSEDRTINYTHKVLINK